MTEEQMSMMKKLIKNMGLGNRWRVVVSLSGSSIWIVGTTG